MRSPFAILAQAINSHPWIVAGILVAVILISASGLPNLSMKSTGYDTFVWEDSEEGLRIDKYNEIFGKGKIILIIGGSDVLSVETLKYIDTLCTDISNEKYVKSVQCITEILKLYNGGTLPSSETEIKNIINKIPEEQKNKHFQSEITALCTISLQNDLNKGQEDAVLKNIRSITKNTYGPPGISVKISGDPAYNKDLDGEMQGEIRTLVGITLAMMLLSIAFLFSYVKYRMLPVAVIAIGLLVAFGILGLMNISITMPAIGAFPVIIGLGIDYGVQFHSRFNDEIKNKNVKNAVYATLTKSGPVHFVAMCTTALGFIALLSSSIPMTYDFGFACTIGVISSFFTALVIVPLTFRIAGYEPKSEKETGSAIMEKYSSFLGRLALRIAKNPVPVLLIFGSAAIIGVQLDDKVDTNVDLNTFIPPDMPAKVDLDSVKSIVGETSTFPVLVEGNDITSTEVIKWIDEFEAYSTDTHPEITGVTSPATLVKKYNNGKIPDTGHEISEILENIPDSEKDTVLKGGITAVVEFETAELNNYDKNSLVTSLRKDIKWLEPPAGISASPTGMSQISGDLVDNVGISKNRMTALGFVMILVFLILVYRRFESLLPVIPVAMILGWNTLIMYLLNIEYTPLTACLGSMTIGLAMDYTILIMERFEEELEKGENFYMALQTGVSKIGSAITISGATTLLGFSSMILSDFNVIKMFGETTVITIFFSLVGGVVVMPAVLSLFYRKTTGDKFGQIKMMDKKKQFLLKKTAD
ncbi:MAG: RND family transporter [Methanomicrobiaceae archaeon]|nr:RND family transporter [Methanomicrobiaceae archaeon]